MKKFNIILLGVLLALPMLSSAQKARLKYANNMFEKNAYYYASEAYEDVLARKTDSMTVAANIAECYDRLGNVEKAIDWYRFLERNDALEQNQMLRLALIERQVENYSGSYQLLASYQDKYGDDKIAKDLVAQNSVAELKKDKGQFNLVLQGVNTSASEMGASFLNNEQVMVYSATRRPAPSKNIQSWSGNFFYDIYLAPIDGEGNIGKMKIMKSEAKTKFNDGPASYCEKTGYVYFTRNNYLAGKKGMDESNRILLKVYKAKLDGNKFVDIEELSINDNKFSNCHPTVSEDGKRLYFSSNRPGGFGGMDIYSVELNSEGNSFGTPVNLGDKINTSQDEVFPHYDFRENILFFSSEGHFGLGGLDVYVAKLNRAGVVNMIENVGAPINSPADDFAFVNNGEQTKGYFASNRSGGQGDDDIYGFKQNFPFRNSAILNGIAKNIKSGSGLSDVTIAVVDKDGNIVGTTQADANGNFELFLGSVDDDFKIVASKDGFIDTEKGIPFDVNQMEYQTEINVIPDLDYFFSGLIRDKKTGAPLEGVKVSIVDNNTNSSFSNLNTNNKGAFESPTMPYKYDNNISYGFKIEKEGYVAQTFDYNDVLKLEDNVDITKRMTIDLTEIEVGKTDLNEVVEINPIYFDFGKFDIRPDAAIELNKVVQVMKDNPGMVIELGSHTDSRGSATSNQTLSDKRAKASAQYIISQGIEAKRISGKGYGKSRLKVSDAEINKAKTEEEKEALHEKNRRTEFIIVKMQ